MKLALPIILIASVLAGCLSKVPPEERAQDKRWQQTSEQLSRPTTLN